MTTATAAKPQLETRPAKPRVAAKPALTLERLQSANTWNDRILAGLTVLVAFWLASFPVTNSDVFRSLAVGRLLAEGKFTFGEDPFTYAAAMHAQQFGEAAPVWVHPAWGFDWIAYQVYTKAGGAGLVLLRGIVFGLLALVLVRIHRRSSSLALSAAMVSLAITATFAHPWFRPLMVTFLFLGLTLYLLWRPPSEGKSWLSPLTALTGGRLWIFLPLLFALWANLDQWFYLGPLVAGLFLLGQTIQYAFRGTLPASTEDSEPEVTASSLAVLAVVVAVGVGACLLNPFRAAAFQSPFEIDTPAFMAFQEADPFYENMDFSPWTGSTRRDSDSPWYRPGGRTLAEWCYFPLVFLGFASFAVNYRGIRFWRVLIWAAAFGFSVWTYRAVGFFAIATAPIAALNFQDWLAARAAARQGKPLRQQLWPILFGQLGRMSLLLWLLALGVLMALRLESSARTPGREAPIGVIHSGGALGWSMQDDLSLQASAQAMARWRAEGSLTGNAFNLHRLFPRDMMEAPRIKTDSRGAQQIENPQTAFLQAGLADQWGDAADYWDWYSPANADAALGARGGAFMDRRFRLHGAVVADFLKASKGICGISSKPPYRDDDAWRETCRKVDAPWKEVFQKYGISHLLLNGELEVPYIDPASKHFFAPPLIDLLLEDRDESGAHQWALLKYDDGRTFVVAWKGSDAWKNNPAMCALEFSELGEVFGRTNEGKPYTGPTLPPPYNGPPREQKQSEWLALIEGTTSRQPLALDRARWYASRFQARLQAYVYNFENPGRDRLAALLALPGQILAGAPPLPMMRTAPDLHEARPFLAIQAARRGVSEKPNDWESYALLLNSYGLLTAVENNGFGLQRLNAEGHNPYREMQVLGCLRRIALLRTDDPDVNIELARRYVQAYEKHRCCLDLAALHYQIFLEEGTKARAQKEVTAEEFMLQLRRATSRHVGADFDQLQRQIEEVKKRVGDSKTDPLVYAVNCVRHGLTLQGVRELELQLQRFPPDTQGYYVAFEHLVRGYMQIGDIPELVRLLQAKEAETILTPVVFNEIRGLAAAAYGDYETALACMDRADALIRVKSAGDIRLKFQAQILGGPPEVAGSLFAGAARMQNDFAAMDIRSMRLCMAGILALEAGKQPEAREYFRRAVEDVNGRMPYRLLANRYHYLMTGEVFKAD